MDSEACAKCGKAISRFKNTWGLECFCSCNGNDSDLKKASEYFKLYDMGSYRILKEKISSKIPDDLDFLFPHTRVCLSAVHKEAIIKIRQDGYSDEYLRSFISNIVNKKVESIVSQYNSNPYDTEVIMRLRNIDSNISELYDYINFLSESFNERISANIRRLNRLLIGVFGCLFGFVIAIIISKFL